MVRGMKETTRITCALFARNVVLFTAGITAGYWISGDKYRFEWEPMDTIATGVFILLLSWLLLPRFRLDDSHLDDSTNSFALRLGKLTKRSLRRLKLSLRPSGAN